MLILNKKTKKKKKNTQRKIQQTHTQTYIKHEWIFFIYINSTCFIQTVFNFNKMVMLASRKNPSPAKKKNVHQERIGNTRSKNKHTFYRIFIAIYTAEWSFVCLLRWSVVCPQCKQKHLASSVEEKMQMLLSKSRYTDIFYSPSQALTSNEMGKWCNRYANLFLSMPYSIVKRNV